MKITNGTWETVKAGYLEQVEKALASVGHREKKQVLEDVRSHLDQRFSELGPDEQTWENMQAIITQMGPASDYAELLAPDTVVTKQTFHLKWFFLFGAVVAISITCLLLLNAIPNKGCYIITFSAVEPFEPVTAKELLGEFNRNHPSHVNTHHFRTRIQGNKLEGLICVDNKTAKDVIEKMIGDNERLKLVSIGPATEEELNRLYAMGQPPLKSEDDQKKPVGSTGPPMVVSTTPMAFANDVSPDLKEITVTFDQPMMNLSWSWVGGGKTFPEMMGQPRYDKNKRTCTLPVKLEAGRFYWVGINSPQHKYFQMDTGVAAVPYVILFATRDENGEPTPIPENFFEEAKSTNSAHGRLAAVDSATFWLGLIDDGDYDASWEEAANIFKNAATKQQWEGMAKTVRQPLGTVISRQVMSKMPTQTVPGGPDGEYVIIQFKTSFENKADAIETVTPMLDKDGVWRVTGYYIR